MIVDVLSLVIPAAAYAIAYLIHRKQPPVTPVPTPNTPPTPTPASPGLDMTTLLDALSKLLLLLQQQKPPATPVQTLAPLQHSFPVQAELVVRSGSPEKVS